MLLDKLFAAAGKCLWAYGRHNFRKVVEHSVEGTRSRVDYVMLVDHEARALCEAKSPSVMKKVGNLLPVRGIKLEWTHSQNVLRRILGKVSVLFFLSDNVWC